MPETSADPAALLAHRQQLREHCRHLNGNGVPDPAEELEHVAAWCRANKVDADRYGEGAFLQAFEAKVADLLGFEAARFMPSGTMAQPLALRIWAERDRCHHVGMHPTSHLELHEERGYAHLHGLAATLVGPRGGPMLAEHLAAVPEHLSALLMELPTRENGGQMPALADLSALLDLARQRGTRCHLDGARLWEAQAGYGVPFADICAGFDSAYVSFYKGIGALPGCMLLGDRDFIAEAVVWQRRQGGNLYTSLPNAASAAMRLDDAIAAMPGYLQRARRVAACFAEVEGVTVLPGVPQVNMFHVFMAADAEVVAARRDAVAEDMGIWLMGKPEGGDQPGTCWTEITLGSAAEAITDDEVREGVRRLLGQI